MKMRALGVDRARLTKGIMVMASIWLLCGCLEPGRPVIAERSPVFEPLPVENPNSPTRLYTVRTGDTMYSIAWRFQLDYRSFARANGVSPPYAIRPGQVLRIRSQLPVGQRVIKGTKAPKPAPKAKSDSARTAKSKSAASPIAKWVWPVAAKPTIEFGRRSKGMDFTLSGQGRRVAVHAANHGEVVYAGNGIGGYERLLIIKHSRDLLSAYSFNGQIRVKEQQRVKAGAKIADISSSGRIKQRLHFELRRDGQPINPRSLLQ